AGAGRDRSRGHRGPGGGVPDAVRPVRSCPGAKSRAFVLSFPVRGALSESDGPTGRLEAWDFNTEKIEQITDGVSSIGVNADGSVLVVRAGRKVRVVP